VDSKQVGEGVVILTYEPAPAGATGSNSEEVKGVAA
jgi:hypothetical protein